MARMRLYFNSFSEMIIPTSVWEQTKGEKLEIFSCMEATEIRDIMTNVFDEDGNTGGELGINHYNLLEPFYINMAINMNNMYNPAYKQELYKYQCTVLVSKMIATTTPDLCRDMMQFVSYTETFSYVQDLKKFRPTMRLQAFIEQREANGGRLTASQESKRKAVCRDWWRLALWYVRLRRAAKKKVVHEDLLRAERLGGPCAPYLNNPNVIGIVKQATLTQQELEEIKESKADISAESLLTESEEEADEDDIDMEQLYK